MKKKKEACHIKPSAGPSRTLPRLCLLTTSGVAAPGLTYKFFSADLLVSFLPECVNHKLIYEGNFYWCHLYLSDCTHFTFLACHPGHLWKISLFSFKGAAAKVKASLTASRL